MRVGLVTANGARVGSGDEVTLAIPASLEFIRIVRLTASGLASRLGFDVEEIDNLRIAVDELAGAVVDASSSGKLEVTFSDGDGELRIEGHSPAAPGRGVGIDDLTAQILNSVCDKYELRVDGDSARFSCVVRLPAL
jgi:anti-sigma regulatory factor (Ser/Thr protein kinase)